MSPLLLLLAPVTVFAILFFFGVVGCASLLHIEDVNYQTTPDGKPDYPGTINKETSLVAYWRLGEPASTPVPSSGGAARSETGLHNGDYEKLAPAAAVDKTHHSPITAGTIALGVRGLLTLSPASTCMRVDGGFVQVPFDDKLNPPEFTLEAWINPDIGLDGQGNYYCLYESTGRPGPSGVGKKQTGFGLYIGPKDVPPKTPPGLYFWQVWMGDGTKLSQVAVSNDPVKFKQLTYIVLTFDGKNLQLFLYYPGTNQSMDQISGELQANVTNFKRNDTSNLGNGDFFIGSGSNLYPTAGILKIRLYPFKGEIQEVALYNLDLSAPNNQGLGKLAGHEMAGGSL